MTALQLRCWRAARTHIEREDTLVHDLCDNLGQILANVKDMRWLQVAVANEMIDTMATYAKLPHFPDGTRAAPVVWRPLVELVAH
jgi:hypothetical protein